MTMSDWIPIGRLALDHMREILGDDLETQCVVPAGGQTKVTFVGQHYVKDEDRRAYEAMMRIIEEEQGRVPDAYEAQASVRRARERDFKLIIGANGTRVRV